MPEQQVEPETANRTDVRTLEVSLQKLWEKARTISELLINLKQENKALRGRVGDLEEIENHLKSQIQERERELERVRIELGKLQSNGNEVFSKEEKEALKVRIKDLIAKINSRL